MKKLLSLSLFFLLIISCKQKDEFTMYDVAGRWSVNAVLDNVLLNLNGSGTYESGIWCENYPLTWSLENNVVEMTYKNKFDETICEKIRIDSVTVDYEGREEYRRLHVTPLSDGVFRDRWEEIKDF